MLPLAERIERNSIPEPNCGCWLWANTIHRTGYGHIQVGEKTSLAHRVSWEAHRGPIPAGLCVLHKCDVRSCVNPNHLFLGTIQDNTDDMLAKGRAFNVRGERHGKLTADQVIAIRADHRPRAQVARDFGISRSAVWAVVSGKTWMHVKEPPKVTA